MARLFQAGGKRIRPALVLLSAKLGRYDFEAVRRDAKSHHAITAHEIFDKCRAGCERFLYLFD